MVFIHDILIYSKDEEHASHLGTVLKILRKERLYGKLKKYKFWLRKLPSLGHVISEDGVSVDHQKMKAVRDWPIQKTVTKVRSFLWLAGCYKRSIQDFSKIVGPLIKLMRKDEKFFWLIECDAAFEELKHRLTTSPILTIPDWSERTVVYSDASRFGLGCVLVQHGRVIACGLANWENTRRTIPLTS